MCSGKLREVSSSDAARDNLMKASDEAEGGKLVLKKQRVIRGHFSSIILLEVHFMHTTTVL
jgi:hypothetical protein